MGIPFDNVDERINKFAHIIFDNILYIYLTLRILSVSYNIGMPE